MTTPASCDDLVRPPWIERRFAFTAPPWMVADLAERLRGTPARIAEAIAGVDEAAAQRSAAGSWSIAQNVGHLADVELLWQERLADLAAARSTLTPALPARFQAAATRHTQRSLAATLAEFRERRTEFVVALLAASPAVQRASAFHQRLAVPMRLVDCAQFAAEHDDHHLLRIRALRATP